MCKKTLESDSIARWWLTETFLVNLIPSGDQICLFSIVYNLFINSLIFVKVIGKKFWRKNILEKDQVWISIPRWFPGESVIFLCNSLDKLKNYAVETCDNKLHKLLFLYSEYKLCRICDIFVWNLIILFLFLTASTT